MARGAAEHLFTTIGAAVLAFSSKAAVVIGYGATAVVLACYVLADGQEVHAPGVGSDGVTGVTGVAVRRLTVRTRPARVTSGFGSSARL